MKSEQSERHLRAEPDSSWQEGHKPEVSSQFFQDIREIQDLTSETGMSLACQAQAVFKLREEIKVPDSPVVVHLPSKCEGHEGDPSNFVD